MLLIISSAIFLTALTMGVHATGIAVLLRNLTKVHGRRPTGVWLTTRMLLRMLWWLILIHVVEISMWGLFYRWHGFLPSVEAAFYFSGVTYTTIGYGDVVLAPPWRLLAPIEGLLGVLMCSLSTGFFFVVVSRVYQSQPEKTDALSSTEGSQF